MSVLTDTNDISRHIKDDMPFTALLATFTHEEANAGDSVTVNTDYCGNQVLTFVVLNDGDAGVNVTIKPADPEVILDSLPTTDYVANAVAINAGSIDAFPVAAPSRYRQYEVEVIKSGADLTEGTPKVYLVSPGTSKR